MRSPLVSTLCYFVAGAACLVATAGDADEYDPLDEIVVTATRLATLNRNTPRSISVVTKDRIQDGTQLLALDEALAGVPGLYMQNRYNFSQDLRISLRGFGARSSFGIRGIRILVDGIPETLPDGQTQVDSIDLGSAKRIEVLRGPASSLYGNASGGVISVVSELGDSVPFAEMGIAVGDYGYERYQIKVGGQTGKLDYLVNASRLDLDGYRDHSIAKGSLLNSKIRFRFTDADELIVALNLTDQPEAQDPGGIDATQAAADPSSARDQNVAFDAGESLNQQRLGLVYQKDTHESFLQLRNYYVRRDFSNRLPFTGGGAVDLDRFFYGVGAQYTFRQFLSPAVSLTVGTDLDRQDDDRKRFDNNAGVIGNLVFDQREQVDSNGVYLQGQWQLRDIWTFSAGLRYDRVGFDVVDRFLIDGDDSGNVRFDEVSSSLGVNRRNGVGVFFASYSSGFETPTTTELANPDGSGGFNSSLRPQTAENYEIGYKTSSQTMFLEFSLFHINLESELIPFELPAFPGRTFYSNAGSSSRTGVETAISWQGSRGFRALLSYTWSDFGFDSFVDDNGEDFSGNQLPGLPQHFAYLSLGYASQNGLSASFETSYSGSLFANNTNTARVESYLVSNIRASYEFNLGRWLVRPYAGINNVFDERYNNNIRINAFGGRYFEPAPDRNIYVGFAARFRSTPGT